MHPRDVDAAASRPGKSIIGGYGCRCSVAPVVVILFLIQSALLLPLAIRELGTAWREDGGPPKHNAALVQVSEGAREPEQDSQSELQEQVKSQGSRLVDLAQRLGLLEKELHRANLPPNAESYSKFYDRRLTCTEMGKLDRVAVVSAYHEKPTWVEQLDLPVLLYTKENPAATYNVPLNRGQEASVYLQFIVDYYDCLPERTVFTHHHQTSWHSTDVVALLKRLCWNETEFASLNIHKWQQVEVATSPDRRALQDAWDGWMRQWLGELPPVLWTNCCAQFVVHRKRILQRPREFYKRALEYALCDPKVEDSYHTSRTMEHTWSYIFGEPAQQPEPDWNKLYSC